MDINNDQVSKFEVSLKSKKFENYIRLILSKNKSEPITTKDLKQIKTLKLNKSIFDDIIIGDLSFFTNLESLSLSDLNLSSPDLEIINSLSGLRTLSITNSHIDFSKAEQINPSVENLIFANCTGINFEHFQKNTNVKNLTIINCSDINFGILNQFENLEELNLPNNKDLRERDLNNVWNLENLKRVNLDGNTQIGKQSHGNIIISQNPSYLPGEKSDWNLEQNKPKKVELSKLTNFSKEQLESLSDLDILITKDDVDFLNTEYGKSLISSLQTKNKINISMNTTADLSMEQLELINQTCDIDRVYVGTGWQTTQERGYSMETYTAIKKEILNIISDIDPNLPDSEKYRIIHDKLSQNIQYDYSALEATSNDSDYYSSRNLENGLLNHTCVCAGYADILKNVLSEVGIESKYVEGKTHTGELHAWNQVRLLDENGKEHWYNVDLTWDSTGKGNKYYLQDDATFSKTHKPILSRTENNSVFKCPSARPYKKAEVDFQK